MVLMLLPGGWHGGGWGLIAAALGFLVSPLPGKVFGALLLALAF